VIQDREPGQHGPAAGAEPRRDAPAAESGGVSGDETLAEAFWSVARQLRGTSQEVLAPFDVTPSHLRALRTLTRHGTMRLSELSARLDIAPRSATEVVDALQTRGLAARRPDPGDRRATLVEVTEHGSEVLGAIRGSEAERIFGRLSEADRAELTRLLRKLQS
jgi:DNA-binding MarR family transcriptional regulator